MTFLEYQRESILNLKSCILNEEIFGRGFPPEKAFTGQRVYKNKYHCKNVILAIIYAWTQNWEKKLSYIFPILGSMKRICTRIETASIMKT